MSYKVHYNAFSSKTGCWGQELQEAMVYGHAETDPLGQAACWYDYDYNIHKTIC